MLLCVRAKGQRGTATFARAPVRPERLSAPPRSAPTIASSLLFRPMKRLITSREAFPGESIRQGEPIQRRCRGRAGLFKSKYHGQAIPTSAAKGISRFAVNRARGSQNHPRGGPPLCNVRFGTVSTSRFSSRSVSPCEMKSWRLGIIQRRALCYINFRETASSELTVPC